AQEVQAQRDEGQSLYGIGVNYYALGDRVRAREFLERSLSIRTVALDGRGRMATLRALATIDAEQGRVENAIAFDREALSLAVAPSAAARIKIQLAAHTAAAGRSTEARAQLDQVISTRAKADSLIRAEALLQRAVLLREMSRPREALAALAAAAFVSADASRAQSLGDVAAQKYSPAVRRALASEFQRREALYRELAARQFALDARVDRSGSDDPHARHLMSDIAELERQADAVNTAIASRAVSAGTARR